MSGFVKSLGKILPIALGAAALIFTAGAALPALGAMIGVGAGGFGAAVGGVVSDLGLTGVLGDVVAGAVTSAGFGALTGGALAGVTGGDPIKGAESGALTGAETGGLLGGLGVTSYASDAGAGVAPAGTVQAPNLSTNVGSISAPLPDLSASQGVAGAADPSAAVAGGATPVTSGTTLGTNGVASSGVGGSTVQTATSAAPTPVAASSAVDTSASAGAAGNTGTSTDYTMGGGDPSNYTLGGASGPPVPPNSGPMGTETAINAPTANPNPVAGPSAPPMPGDTHVGNDGVKYTYDGTKWAPPGGLTSSLFGNGGALGSGGLGYVIGGLGTGLGTWAGASDTAKYAATAAKTAVGVTQANYGTSTDPVTGAATSNTGGGLMNQSQQPTGLRSPAQAFNPTARWVYDPTSKALVLVGATGAQG